MRYFYNRWKLNHMCWMTRCVMNAPVKDAAANSHLFSAPTLRVCRYVLNNSGPKSKPCRSFWRESIRSNRERRDDGTRAKNSNREFILGDVSILAYFPPTRLRIERISYAGEEVLGRCWFIEIIANDMFRLRKELTQGSFAAQASAPS